ncbi:MAG: hypothetical protein HZA10_01650 [Nitrospirae bacterium]|nr:hypothetical protein [Nitrospirota bacterium]
MRLILFSLLTVFAVFVSHPAFAGTAATIDELVAPYDSSKCGECHDDIHKDWAGSWHGKSIVDPRVLKTFKTFILSGLDKSKAARKDLKDVCLGCHAPQIRDASDELVVKISDMIITAVDDKNEAKREAAKKELAKLNINCIACHNLYAVPDGNPQPKTIYGTGKAQDTTPHKDEIGFNSVKSEYFKTSKFCGKCHGCELPSKECPTIYSSYEEHYLMHGGKETCQGCHMKEASHKFPGIYEKDFAKDAVEINISASPTEYVYHLENRIVPGLVMNIKLTNHSGHGIPHG